MTSEKKYRIDLPILFASVNRSRREQGLMPVEPAVMAVRVSIKFAIRHRKHLELKGTEVEIPESDAQHLCDTLGELFNVRLDVSHAAVPDATPDPVASGGTGRAPSKGAASDERVELPLAAFYAAFNKTRRARGLMPVEPAVISVRTGVKFAIMRHRPIELQATRVVLDAEDLRVLEQILLQQFDVSIPGGLLSLCEAVEPAAQRGKSDKSAHRGKESGVVSRLMDQLVGGRERARRYSLDTNSLLLAILKRRSAMGHKPMSPEVIRKKCADNLRMELQLKTDMRDPDLGLSEKQLDVLADIIRREFQIIFDDMTDLMRESVKGNADRAVKLKRQE